MQTGQEGRAGLWLAIPVWMWETVKSTTYDWDGL